MGKIYKKPVGASYPAPKRGKARMKAKVTPMKKKTHKKPFVPYVRHGQKTDKSHSERAKLTTVLKDVYKCSNYQIIKLLKKVICRKKGNDEQKGVK